MDESLRLLKELIAEVNRLRRENEIHRARLGVYDNMMTLFHSKPSYESQGMSLDIAWEATKFIQQEESRVNQVNPD